MAFEELTRREVEALDPEQRRDYTEKARRRAKLARAFYGGGKTRRRSKLRPIAKERMSN